MKLKKLFTTFVAGTLMLTLAACGSNSADSSDSQKSSETTSSKVTKKHNNKAKVNKNSKSSNEADSDSQSNGTQNSNKDGNYSVSSTHTTTPNSNSVAKSSVKQNKSASSSSQQLTMNATDAKNIVKEHIGNQLSDRGIAGQSTDDLPSIDSVDGYTATQNGTNDWTVSGNGHTYHVTANSVTGK